MAVQISEQYYVSNGYIDQIMTPYATFQDLRSIPSTKLFNGLKAVVNNNGLPVTFIFVGDVKQRFYWVIRNLPAFPTYADLTATTNDIVTTIGAKTKAFYVGLEATVQSGETTGEVEKYVVTEVNNGVPTWEIVVSKGTDISTDPAAVADMLNAHEVGNLVYTTGPVYSYESGDPAEVVYTADQAEAAGQAGYTEYPEGLYLVSDDSNGDVALSDVVINNSTDGLSIKVIGDDIRDDIE